MRLLAVSLLIAPYLVLVMTVASMAQPAASQMTPQYQGIYQGGHAATVPRRAVNKKDRSMQSIPRETRQGCRHLYSGGPKSVVPHTC